MFFGDCTVCCLCIPPTKKIRVVRSTVRGFGVTEPEKLTQKCEEQPLTRNIPTAFLALLYITDFEREHKLFSW